jgi:hypothetical protein
MASPSTEPETSTQDPWRLSAKSDPRQPADRSATTNSETIFLI